eukprot:CAMPEP_0117423348 /NCGR_PEP_ID=MMETSP0758-20121206/3992_1 /TAXON_ID=63605 /ORGANISM="Percolomonas cosmopolitus, Strain AE-1 (ATCC 50343)" /LENGTH=260 /DNA_ID=CAMNT_0005206487 /DNA_START=182 /DNA_END=964 /DNA_ORIENTATION=+
MKSAGLKACVVSVSGGVDSAVTLALMSHAAKQKDSPIEKVYGIAQPIASTAKIQNRAYECEQAFDNVTMITVDQTEIWRQLSATVEKSVEKGEKNEVKGKAFASGQLKSYMRTPVNYYVSQLLSQQGYPCIVMGTGNYDEDGYLYYFCKAGDGVADVQLINDLHKSEVFEVGARMGVPKSILVAKPSADLWEGQEDEEEIGASYDFIELYTELLKKEESEKTKKLGSLSEEATKQYNELSKLIETIHRRNKHKDNYPYNL